MKGTRAYVGSGKADKPNRCLPVVKEYKRWELNRIRPYLGSNCTHYEGHKTHAIIKERLFCIGYIPIGKLN